MKERTEILEETFRKLAEEKKFASLRDLMQTLYPADIAAILSDLPEKYMSAIFRLLPKDLAADTFVEMESDVKEIKADVKSLNAKPGKRWDSIVDKVIWAVLAAVIAFILGRIGL